MIRPGTYVLAMTFRDDVAAEIGRLGTVELPKGMYCYVGSAMNGLDQRLGRHMRAEKTKHWHIDHLTVLADGMEAFECTGTDECGIRRTADECGMSPVVPGFGCSDCRCDTHLLAADAASLRRLVTECGMAAFIL